MSDISTDLNRSRNLPGAFVFVLIRRIDEDIAQKLHLESKLVFLLMRYPTVGFQNRVPQTIPLVNFFFRETLVHEMFHILLFCTIGYFLWLGGTHANVHRR